MITYLIAQQQNMFFSMRMEAEGKHENDEKDKNEAKDEKKTKETENTTPKDQKEQRLVKRGDGFSDNTLCVLISWF